MNLRLAVLWMAACGGKADVSAESGSGNTASGSGSSAAKPIVDAVSRSSPIDGDPAFAVVERAFHDKKPAFPLLSRNGNVAAVEIMTPIGQSGGSTYTVTFIPSGTDASSGSESEHVTLVDARLVHLLLDSMDTSAVPTIDIDTITKAATGVTDRIAADGFTRFGGSVDPIDVREPIALGPFALRIIEEATTITIVINKGGKKLATEQIQPVPMGRVGSVDCVAVPVAKRAWFDAGRKRMLLHVGWNTNADQCDVPDARYRLVGDR